MKNQRGLALIELMTSVSVSLFLLLGAGSLTAQAQRFYSTASRTADLFDLHTDLFAKLSDESNFRLTLNSNGPALDCLINPSMVCPSKPTEIVFFEGPTAPRPIAPLSWGIDENGRLCDVATSTHCYFRFLTTWEPISRGSCDPTIEDCRPTLVRISGRFVARAGMTPPTTLSFNLNTLDVVIYRGLK